MTSFIQKSKVHTKLQGVLQAFQLILTGLPLGKLTGPLLDNFHGDKSEIYAEKMGGIKTGPCLWNECHS